MNMIRSLAEEAVAGIEGRRNQLRPEVQDRDGTGCAKGKAHDLQIMGQSPSKLFTHPVASLLGSPNSRRPGIFNTGAIITGVALIAGGYGMYHALRSRRISPVLSCLAALSMAVVGGTTIQAGIFPLPDHRHTAFGFLVIFLIVLPLILLLALWNQGDARGVRAFLFACCLAVLLIAPLMSHLIVIPGAGAGLLQRIFAAVTFLPVGVVGWKLRYCATKA